MQGANPDLHGSKAKPPSLIPWYFKHLTFYSFRLPNGSMDLGKMGFISPHYPYIAFLQLPMVQEKKCKFSLYTAPTYQHLEEQFLTW